MMDTALYQDTSARLVTRGIGGSVNVGNVAQCWIEDDGKRPGSREDAVPTIVLAHGFGDRARVVLTWAQARAVALALIEIESTAREG